MSWKFNPPPGWPEQPEGWVPPPGWTPDPNWPPPPAGWQFWVPATQAPAPASPAPPPQAAPLLAAPPPAASAPAATPPLTMVPPPLTVQGGSAPPYPGGPSGPGSPYASAHSGSYPPMPGGAPPPYSAATRPRRAWFGQWWGILGLIALLLLGAAIGYGATRVALDSSEDDSALGPAVTSYDPSQTIDDGHRGAPQ
jgi:hypothetical protein